jgi:hypothetical protein
MRMGANSEHVCCIKEQLICWFNIKRKTKTFDKSRLKVKFCFAIIKYIHTIVAMRHRHHGVVTIGHHRLEEALRGGLQIAMENPLTVLA